jgi:hypothetical protein
MLEGYGAGSVLVANGSGCGSGRPKTYVSYGSGSTRLKYTIPEEKELPLKR